jgi:hypothetical protein
MEAKRFDSLTRSLVSPSSRRRPECQRAIGTDRLGHGQEEAQGQEETQAEAGSRHPAAHHDDSTTFWLPGRPRRVP